ncbi:AraC family transcriptional regulator [Cohnella sp. CFH 77786]|uniref:helix-turn-helix domain-containing protein n=1 Tax=Cohnella sp. CFH 77786 TaxID=2662265 RepID=UPI001C60E443
MPTVLLVAGPQYAGEAFTERKERQRTRSRVCVVGGIREARDWISRRPCEAVMCDLEFTGMDEGVNLLLWVRKFRPQTACAAIVPEPGLSGLLASGPGGPYPFELRTKPSHPDLVLSLALGLLEKSGNRREMTFRGNHPAPEKYWMRPVRLSIRRWRIALTSKERELLVFALLNVADELLCRPGAGYAAARGQEIAVWLTGPSVLANLYCDLERVCERMKAIAGRYFYADLSYSIGETVPMKEFPSDGEALPPACGTWGKREPCVDQVVLEKVLAYIDRHLQEDFSREDVARCVHYHPVYLSRFFKKMTGWSLSEYIVHRRIEQAKAYLAQPDLKVGHVMIKLGYGNPSNFTRTFKKITGYTPRQYRRSLFS